MAQTMRVCSASYAVDVLAVAMALSCSSCSGASSRAPDESTRIDADSVKDNSLLLLEHAPNGEAGDGSPLGVYTTRVDGTAQTLLADDGISPNWTPDGRIIFSSNRSGSDQIWIMDEDGGSATQLGNLPPEIRPIMPQMGENGTVVFMGLDPGAQPDTNAGIYAMQADGSGLTQLTSGMQPFLARSGTWVVYTLQTEDPYHRQLWRIDVDGTGQKQLTFLGDPDYPDANAPNISPDESTIAFFSGTESEKLVPGAPPQPVTDWGYRNVAIIPAAGGERKTLTPCKPVATQAELEASTVCIAADNPAWSPDGAWLVFDTGGHPDNWAGGTWMVDLNGEDFQQFYPEGRGTVRVPLKFDGKTSR